MTPCILFLVLTRYTKRRNSLAMNKIIFIILCVCPSLLLAWPAAIDLNADNGDSNSVDDVYHLFPIGGESYDRCDTSMDHYSVNDPNVSVRPDECHRWGLVWNATLLSGAKNKQTQWTPAITLDSNVTFDTTHYRLPTIKELARLYDYTGSGFAAHPVIYDKLTDHIANWLISSSYRDVDGRYNSEDQTRDVWGATYDDHLQVLAINIKTGEIRAFDPFNLNLCKGFISAVGACELDSTSTRNFHQLLVKIQ